MISESRRRAAVWVVRASLGLVSAVGLSAPFLLEPQQAVLISPLLILAALGGWYGWRSYAAADVSAMPALSTVPVRGTVVPSTATDARVAGLQAELDKVRNLQSELMLAKQGAEAAMMAKSEFLATMSHEIRTPLNGIIPLLDILLTSKLAPDQKDYLQTAYQSARELLRIVDDILDYSKIEAGKLELETVGLNLRETLDSVQRLMERGAEAKGLKFEVIIEPAVRLVMRGDPVRLRQVLTNLVSNAIKFTPRGSISIQVSKRAETRTQSELMFSVRDTGIGIAPEAAAKLFQPFSQADASTTRTHGGTGLGLVICKRIVDLMKGKMGVKSELGKGSVFWFSVPMQKALGDIAGVRRSLHGTRALILSTSQPVLNRLHGYFDTWGIRHLPTASAPDALAKLRASSSMGESWSYDLLVIDLNAVNGDPATLLRNIARDTALEQVRFVLIASDNPMAPPVTTDNRALVVPRAYAERELNAALQQLLEVSEGISERVNMLAGSVPELQPQMQIAQPDIAARPLAGHVLLVEDNVVNRQVAQRLLSLIGVSFVIAENGQEALDKLKLQSFDAILMDCQMPVMDGYTATRARRQQEGDPAIKHIPIIAMTANAMAGDREKCLNAGMDDYMSKPLNRALLEQTLRKWLPQDARAQATPARVASAPAPVPSVAQRPMAIGVPISAGSSGNALDATVIGDLIDVMGDEFTDLVRVYLEDTPKSIGALEQASRQRSIEGFIAPSHSLKSTSANLGAMRLSELARNLEHGARIGDIGGEPAAVVSELKREYQRVAAELNALLAKGSN